MALALGDADAELEAREVVPAAARLVETPDAADPDADAATDEAPVTAALDAEAAPVYNIQLARGFKIVVGEHTGRPVKIAALVAATQLEDFGTRAV